MKFLKNFDFFGRNITISYKNNRYKTYIGLAYSIGIAVLGIVSLIYFSKNMFLKLNPTIIQSRFYDKTLESAQFEKNNLFFTFAIYSFYKNQEFINESIYQLQAYAFVTDRSLPAGKQLYHIDLHMEPCQKHHIPNNTVAQNYFKNKPYNNFYCINTEEYKKLEVIGEYDDNFYKSLSIHVIKCVNSTEKIKCSPEKEVNKYFQPIWIELFYITSEINIEEYKNPIQLNGRTVFYEFSNKNRKNLEIHLQQLEILTDDGVIFKEENIKSSAKVEKLIDRTFELTTNISASYQFYFSKNRIRIKRSYEKLPSVFANLGGFLNIFFIFGNFCIKPIAKLFFYFEVINSNFYIKTLDDDSNTDLAKKKKTKRKNFNEDIFEGNINKVNQSETPIKMIENIKNRNLLIKLNTSFSKLFWTFFKKKSNFKTKEEEILKYIVKTFTSKCDLNSILEKIFEIDLLKSLIFNEDQLELFESIPKFQFNIENLNKKVDYYKMPFEEAYDAILKKTNKNEIDYKLLNLKIKKQN